MVVVDSHVIGLERSCQFLPEMLEIRSPALWMGEFVVCWGGSFCNIKSRCGLHGFFGCSMRSIPGLSKVLLRLACDFPYIDCSCRLRNFICCSMYHIPGLSEVLLRATNDTLLTHVCSQ